MNSLNYFCGAEEVNFDEPEYYGDTFDWKNSGPMEFIELLINMKNEKCPTYSVHRIHKDWIERKHLPKLIELVNSDEPCANVSMTISSVLDCTKSTVGKEAAFLIKGFIENRYPPELNSGSFDYSIVEVKSWWQNYRNKIYNEEQRNTISAEEKRNSIE